VVVIGESEASAETALGLAERHGRVSVVAGVHPHDAAAWDDRQEARLRRLAADPRVVALGEMGLDYHYDHSPRDVQQRVFERQLELAAEARLPVVIHAREADDDVATILRRHPEVSAVLHSFSSGPALLQAGLELGHYVSFSGMITFRNWTMDDAVRAVPLDRLMVETDSPYLAPVPMRGRRNEPALVRYVAERLATVRGLDVATMIARTGANAARCFGIRLAESGRAG